MDNPRYSYSPITERAPLEWPDGARVALVVVLNVEHFYFDRPSSDLDWKGPQPDTDGFAQRDYGSRVGFWRLLELFDRHRIRVTAAVNSDVFEHYPQIAEAGRERDWEWVGHGRSNSMALVGLDVDAERAVIQESAATIERHTGRRPRGWLSPRVAETWETADLLAETGFDYVLDWCADELPFALTTRSGPILSMPYSRELNDLPTMVRRNHTPEQFHDMIRDQLDVLRADGGRVMVISLHPFVSGHPYRAKWVDRALAYVRQHGDVWSATAGEVADVYLGARPGASPSGKAASRAEPAQRA